MLDSTSEDSHIVELHSGVICLYKDPPKEAVRKKRWT